MNADFEEINLTKWKEAFLRGDFDPKDIRTQIEAGWYDWFCEDDELSTKTKSLGRQLLQILDGTKKIDPEKSFVFFKNNCPVNGDLYDQFSICDIATGDVLYVVIPRYGHNGNDKNLSVLWGADNDFKQPMLKGSWKTIVKYFTT